MKLFNDIQLGHGIAGGVILGFSSTVYLYMTGRISGMSGILESLTTSSLFKRDHNLTYTAGLLTSGLLMQSLSSSRPLTDASDLKIATIIFAGVLTGFGARLGGGCTSGHGERFYYHLKCIYIID